jgi:hypothetical protein
VYLRIKDTGGKLATGINDTEFYFLKIINGPKGIRRGLGKLIHEKPAVENLTALSF